MATLYKEVPTSLNFAERELDVLEYWKEHGVFKKSVAQSEGKPEFTFYDGPPTANGMPHIGHVLTRAIKDLIPRYRTMKGYNVLRKAGWDTHGLPVELEVEKQLGLDGKPQIEKYGIEPFIKKCKESVWKYKGEWERLSDRVGFWADMEHPYVTYEDYYIESVWWSIKQIHEKGLLYKGYKVVPYCPRCGTALSSHEVAQGYEDVEETSLTARFIVSGRPDTHILAWTTTPWTLPSNIALCVNADEEYGDFDVNGRTYIMAEALAGKVLPEGARLLRSYKGSELVGLEYEQLFRAGSVPEGQRNRVVADPYVTMDDGVGIVHLAPYGEDDMRILKREGLGFHIIVDAQGRFTQSTPWPGVFVKDADQAILADLKARGQLHAALPYQHSYPFCWRCDTPLLYYPRENWFIKMTAVRDELMECNRSVNWMPETIKEGRMGNFIENVIDWGVSRERYWGTPLPVWLCSCGHIEVIGSRAELMEKGTNVPPENMELHKPYIDAVDLICPKCGKPMKREPHVIDCWYDSGSMPFAQWHYPFENKEIFERRFPADFISEAIDQTRGWFYTLLAISTCIFGVSSFKNCLVLGHVGDKDGVKMSKHKGNVISPWEMLDTRGADAVRWYFYTGSAPWLPSRFSGEAVSEAQRKYMGTLWNTYAFWVLYANIDSFNPTEHELDHSKLGTLDRWILSRLQTLIGEVDGRLDKYEITESGRALAAFVDELSNWYVRRGRERYWGGGMQQDKVNAFMTLYTVLVTLAKLTAPFTPFIAEELYLNLVHGVDSSAPESVHLCDFPKANPAWVDRDLEANMARVLDIVALGRTCRNLAGVKNRQPVPVLYVEGAKLPQGFTDLVADELNVKAVEYVQSADGFVSYKVKPQLKTLGRRFGKNMPLVNQILQGGDGTPFVKSIQEQGFFTITVDGKAEELRQEDILVEVSQRSDFFTASEAGVSVALDARLTPELIEEGFVREVISKVQQLRREAGFEVTDHIALRLDGPEAALGTALKNRSTIAAEVLADSVEAGRGEGFGREQNINGEEMFFTVVKVS